MKRKREQERAGPSHAVLDDFDVFLNHRGPDVKATFVAHLEEALRCAGFRSFLDARSLMKGNQAPQSIDQALNVAKVHVAVVSKRYAESKYCLNELVAVMRSGKPVIPVFYDVEPVDLRQVENEPFAEAFEKHKSRGRTETKLQEWRDALQALSEITGFRSADYKRDEALLKRDIVNEVSRLTPSNQPVEVEQFKVGLDGSVNRCIQILEDMGDGPGMLGLLGMGGIGKTTLAREIYNHFVTLRRFKHMTFLEIRRGSSTSNVEVRPTQIMDLRKQLLLDLLSVQDNTLKSNYNSWFEKLSSLGPVFIAVDDVHKRGQFEELIPFTSVLHPESRIVVTSRDGGVLNYVAERSELNHHMFDVCPLNWNESNVLFNWHAFQAKEAVKGYESVAEDVVRACSGVPLALKVIGSSLFNKQLNGDQETIWREAVIVLRRSRDVMDVLRWSYDSLPESEKHMFLDITCLFLGKSREEAFAYWRSCKHCISCGGGIDAPHTSLGNLIDKNLVMSIQDNCLGAEFKVHDFLKELGQEIGMKTKRHFVNSRDAEAIVTKNQGSENTIRLNLGGSKIPEFEAGNFSSMPNLHYLQLPRGCKVNGDFRSMPKDLRWLQWQAMPFTRIPAGLNLSFLTELNFSHSKSLAKLWTKSNKTLESCSNLRLLNLSNCTSITRLPDSMGQSIEVLLLTSCVKLEMLPPSIKHLKGLTRLDLFGCTSLKALPDSIGALSNLEHLRAYDCTSLQALPTSIGLLSSLQVLDIGANPECQITSEDTGIGFAWTRLRDLRLWNCCGLGSLLDYDALKSLKRLTLLDSALIEFPESMGKLFRLRCLTIHCERLQCLPNAIGDLKMLETLRLYQCHNLTRLPKRLGAISSLEDIEISNCPIRKLPKSLGLLSKLQRFRIRDCKNLQKLPSSIRFLQSLRDFQFVDCGSRVAIGSSSTGLQDLLECNALETLRIQDSTFTEVVESLGQSVPLDQLTVGCERLQCLPNSFGYLKMLQTLELSGCLHLTRLPKNLGAVTSLKWLIIRCCPIRKLPRSIGLLSQLRTLTVTGCKNLEKLPTSIRKLHSLVLFELEDCGSIEAMGALTTLQGLPIWGSTSISELPASSMGVVSTLTVYSNSSFFNWYRASSYNTLQVFEEDKSGFLKVCQHKVSGKIKLLRGVH